MPPASSTSRKRKPDVVNILDLIPERNRQLHFSIREESLEKATPKDPGATGTVGIKVPRFRGRLGHDLCRILHISPWININLDAYGSLVWLRIDGHRTVHELGAGLKEEFGDKAEPIYVRLAEFLSLLERNRIIKYANLPPKAP